jgi:hypothetical protein
MCFAIAACGFAPRCALDESDSAIVRFVKILDLIAACAFSIHDVSRVELDSSSGLPRFNMPLELGVDLGLRLKGPAALRKRRMLILDAVRDRYDRTLSDLSGMDIEVHGNDAARLIKVVRDWLNVGRDKGAPPLPGSVAITHDYSDFRTLLVPDIIAKLRLDDFDVMPHRDYMHVVETALLQIEAARRAEPPASAKIARRVLYTAPHRSFWVGSGRRYESNEHGEIECDNEQDARDLLNSGCQTRR